MPSAVEQAIGATGALRGAATASVATDPLMKRYAEEVDASTAANREAQKRAGENIAARQAIAAEPSPEREPVPRLKPLPAAPNVRKRDAISGIGMFLPVIAALGAKGMKGNAVGALRAAAGAMRGFREGQTEAAAEQHKNFLTQLQATINENNQLTQQYQLILNDRTMTMNERQSKVTALAASFQDELALAGLRTGNMKGLHDLITMRDATTGQLTEVFKDIQDNQRQDAALGLTAKRLAEDIKQNGIQNGLAVQRLEIDGRSVSMGDAIGPILAKIAAGGTPTEGEKQAMATYEKLRENSGYPMPGAGSPYGGGAPAAGAPAPAGPAAAPQATVTAPPPSMLKEGVVSTLQAPDGSSQKWTLRGGKAVQVP